MASVKAAKAPKAAKTVKESKPVKDLADDVTSAKIDNHIEEFLASGGKIQEIPLGVSGQVATSGPRHITLGKRHSG